MLKSQNVSFQYVSELLVSANWISLVDKFQIAGRIEFTWGLSADRIHHLIVTEKKKTLYTCNSAISLFPKLSLGRRKFKKNMGGCVSAGSREKH